MLLSFMRFSFGNWKICQSSFRVAKILLKKVSAKVQWNIGHFPIWQNEQNVNLQFISLILFKGLHLETEYRQLIAKIELFNKYLVIISIGVVLFNVISPLPVSFSRYLSSDKGEDSFYLYCPSWFVFLKCNYKI